MLPKTYNAIGLLCGALFIAFMVWCGYKITQNQKQVKEAPCSEFGSWSVKDVPARCLSYFQDGGKLN